ncbi:MAG: hypothetical protein QOI31_1767 [Solirubrobacterales bacterium]|nr:hypothetical protein [Solirubrobacterales bacterium]
MREDDINTSRDRGVRGSEIQPSARSALRQAERPRSHFAGPRGAIDPQARCLGETILEIYGLSLQCPTRPSKLEGEVVIARDPYDLTSPACFDLLDPIGELGLEPASLSGDSVVSRWADVPGDQQQVTAGMLGR